MQKGSIKYIINAATESEISLHLKNCSNQFLPPLSSRIGIEAYSKKIFEKATRFEAWEQQVLVGLIASYHNEENRTAFITNVSVMKDFSGYGIASALLKMCTEWAVKNELREIVLDVNLQNVPAISFYKKFDFIEESKNGDEIVMKRNLININKNIF